ncbi:calcification associated soluble matrix protein 2 [Penaeus vannamei]|uniref:Calcification associated soluble matrix protein 2 n=1 Tax=Penaeus vannamei TaxID=6689 RepID=A0A423U8B0_PENVA|nr:calcification associated soluble matrix protein 2 [Penaeus vannamei]
MKTAVLLLLVAAALADKPDSEMAILRSDQHHPNDDGAHSFDFETENGISFHVSGSQGATGGANSIGDWSQRQRPPPPPAASVRLSASRRNRPGSETTSPAQAESLAGSQI